MSSSDSGFTSDVARVLRGRVSHQKNWARKIQSFVAELKWDYSNG